MENRKKKIRVGIHPSRTHTGNLLAASEPAKRCAATAPSAANELTYPNVARLSSSEAFVGAAIADLCLHLGWRRVGIITERLAADAPSPWSDELFGDRAIVCDVLRVDL